MFDKKKNTAYKRKFLTLELKTQILDRFLKGENTLNLSEVIVRTHKKTENRIRSAAVAGSSISAKYAVRSRALIMKKL